MGGSTPRNKKCGISSCEGKLDDPEKAISCRICKKWYHLLCVSVDQEVSDFLKNNKCKGVVWKCDNCAFEQPSLNTLLAKISSLEKLVSNKFEVVDERLSNIYDTSLVKKVSDPIAIITKTVSVQTLDLISQSSDASADENDDVLLDIQPETRNFTCSYYKKGTCRHGSSGKKLMDGKECKFLHPPKCVKYCRYGNSPIRGCKGPCKLMHPILCKSSIQYKSCLAPNCTFAHLAGTKRTRDNVPPEFNRNDYYSSSRVFQRNPVFERETDIFPNVSGFPKWNQNPTHPVSNNSRSDFPPLVGPTVKRSDVGSENHLTLNALNNLQSSVNSLLQRAAINNMEQPRVFPLSSSLNEDQSRGQYSTALPPVLGRNGFTQVHPAKNYQTLPYAHPQ